MQPRQRIALWVRFCWIVAAITCVVLVLLFCRRWGTDHGKGPLALCRVTSVTQDWQAGGIVVALDLKPHDIWGWHLYPGDRNGHEAYGRDMSSGYPDRNMHAQELKLHLSRTGGVLDCWQKDYVTRDSSWGTRGQEVAAEPSFDWRDPVPLVEMGETYTVVPGQPLLFGRTMNADGRITYWWFSVFGGRTREPKVSPGPYWPTKVVVDGPDRLRAELTWEGSEAPPPGLLEEKLAPRYRVVKDGCMKELPAKADLTQEAIQPESRTLTLSVTFRDIPADYQDVFALCTLADGMAMHPPVEVPLRRQQFFGELYPLGVVKAARATRVNDSAYDMAEFHLYPQLGAIVGYGQSIYLIDPQTLVRQPLWQPQPTDPAQLPKLPQITACDVSPAGDLLVFATRRMAANSFYGTTAAIHFLDLRTRQIVGTVRIAGLAVVSALQFNPTGEEVCAIGGESERYLNQGPVICRVGVREGGLLAAVPVELRHVAGMCGWAANTRMRPEFLISPDTELALVGLSCGCILAVDTRSGTVRWQVQAERLLGDSSHCLSFRRGGSEVWTSDYNAILRRNAVTGQEIGRLSLVGWDPLPTNPSKPFWVKIWARLGDDGPLAIQTSTTITGQFGGIVVYAGAEPMSAKQCIQECFPNRSGAYAGRTSLVGFVDEKHLLLKYVGIPGTPAEENLTAVCELLLVDLDLVPSLDSPPPPAAEPVRAE